MKKKSKPLTYEECMLLIPEIAKLTHGLVPKDREDQIKIAHSANIKTIFIN